MQFEEIHPADIPVVVTGFGVKYKLIGEQLVQLVGNGLGMLVRYSDVGFHASLYLIMLIVLIYIRNQS
ncbi:hypothetical protein D3C86_1996280 [compost metagenome]